MDRYCFESGLCHQTARERAFYEKWVKEKEIADPEIKNEVWWAMQYCSRNRTPWEEEYWEEEPDTDE